MDIQELFFAYLFYVNCVVLMGLYVKSSWFYPMILFCFLEIDTVLEESWTYRACPFIIPPIRFVFSIAKAV